MRSSPQESSHYNQLEDDWERPVAPATSQGSSSSRGRQVRRFFGRKKKRSNSLGSSASAGFSQSEDFQNMLKEKGNSTPKGEGGGDGDEEEEVYLVRQRYGYFSMLFSLAQVIILIIMMAQCGVAPLKINPMVGPYPDALSEWGGKNAVNILEDGEWWRLMTPILLHAGVIHLLCNVAVQLETGAFFEREWGSTNWLIIYLVSAVGSSMLSVIVMPNAISVGSSGAVMGLFGGKIAEIICRSCEPSKDEQQRIGHQVRKEQCAGVSCSVIIVMLFSFIPYVDWAAHLGGLIAGFCVGIILFALEVQSAVWKLVWLLLGVGFTAIYFVLAAKKMYSGDIEPAEELRDVCGYYKQYFDDYECNCMREENED